MFMHGNMVSKTQSSVCELFYVVSANCQLTESRLIWEMDLWAWL